MAAYSELMIFTIRRWRSSMALARAMEMKNEELQKAFQEIKQLKGIIPICASCKKIRDDAGFWHSVEAYIHSHSKADFSHCICPDCMRKMYPDFIIKEPSSGH